MAIILESPCKCYDGRHEEYQDADIFVTPWGSPYKIVNYYHCMNCEESWEHEFLIPSNDLEEVFRRTTQ